MNGSNSEESIYDVFNHKFLGEISDGTKMGRWSVGYYYSENVNAWFLVKTRETTQQIKLMAVKKDKVISLYEELCEEYATVAQRMVGNLPDGVLTSNKELEEEYKKQYAKFVGERSDRKREKKKKQIEEMVEQGKRIRELKDTHYIDYIKYNYFSRYSPGNDRKDYLWINKNGDLVFQGNYWHGGECYLIGSSIKGIRTCFEEVKKLIKEYCENKTGFCIEQINEDISDSSREMAGYLRKTIKIDTLKAEDIEAMYDNMLRTREFPSIEDIKAVKERYYERNRWEKENR